MICTRCNEHTMTTIDGWCFNCRHPATVGADATIAALTAERDRAERIASDERLRSNRATEQRDAAVARADLAMKGAEQEMRNSRHFVERGNQLHADNLSLRAALTEIGGETTDPVVMRRVRAALSATPAATGTKAFWWCPECKAQVDGSAVTYEEHHEACGQRVAAKEAPSPAPDAELVTISEARIVAAINAFHNTPPFRAGDIRPKIIAALGAAGRTA